MSVSPSPENPGLLNWFLVCSLGVIWGAAFMSVRIALEGFPPATVAAGRIGLGAAALWSVAALLGQPLRRISQTAGREGWMYVTMIGWIAIALPFSLLSWGQQHVPSAFAGVAMGTVPLLVVPLVWMFSPEEGIGPRRIIGVFVGFVGLVVLVGPGALDAGSSDWTLWGRLACIGAACCYAIGSVMTRRAPAMPPISLAAGMLVTASIIVVPIALIKEGLPVEYPVRPGLALAYAALFPTALATLMRVRIVTTAGSLFMSMTSYMVPVWSVIFGMVLMGEALPPQLFAGLALILIGIGISQSRALQAALTRKG